MTVTTIKVPKATRDRLHRLAAADGVTLAQEIDKLVSERSPRPRPTTGGFRSDRPLSAEEIAGQSPRLVQPVSRGYPDSR
jgi:hypothetical protein